MLLRSSLAGTLPLVEVKVLMSAPFLRPPPKMVESPAPHAVVSDEMGSTMNTAETMLRSAATAGISVGAFGGAEPKPGLPQLNSPPEPLRLTTPGTTGQLFVGLTAPKFPQSWIGPGGASVRMFPSSSNHVDGAAKTWADMAASATAATATDAARATFLRPVIARILTKGPWDSVDWPYQRAGRPPHTVGRRVRGWPPDSVGRLGLDVLVDAEHVVWVVLPSWPGQDGRAALVIV